MIRLMNRVTSGTAGPRVDVLGYSRIVDAIIFIAKMFDSKLKPMDFLEMCPEWKSIIPDEEKDEEKEYTGFSGLR